MKMLNKKILCLGFLIAMLFNVKAQGQIDCNKLCVRDISIDTASNYMHVYISFYDTIAINYPDVFLVMDSIGDTIATSQGFNQFQHDDSMYYELLTDLDSVRTPLTLHFAYAFPDDTCILSYPPSIPCSLMTEINDIYSTSDDIRVLNDPESQNVTIEFSNPHQEKHTLIFYDMQGRNVHTMSSITAGKAELEKQLLSGGMYFVQLLKTREVIGIKKLIIE